jgi:GDP-D-mannose dehydratase
MKYCKWHNATSHDTNECKVFLQQIQMAFEQGKLKFETPKKTMKIDQHPFATNMVDVARDKGSSQAKILTSSSAKISGVVDPKPQITADEVKGKSPQDEAEC